MGTVFEIAGAVVLLVLGVLVARRFPDTRAGFGKDLDDALYRAACRATWLFVAVFALVVLLLWLLH